MTSQNVHEDMTEGEGNAEEESTLSVVSAFRRGLAVIRCFTGASPSLTIAEVARSTGLNRATARRFLHTLEIEGYAVSEHGRYRLRPTVLELGYSYLASMSIDQIFQDELHGLAERLHESASAAVLDGHDVVFISRAVTSFPRMMTLALHVGTRMPAYVTAIGRVLLADLDDDELDEYLATAELRAETSRTITDPGRLRAVLMEVRERGYAALDQEVEAGINAIAVPVRQPNRPTIGISVAAHASRTSVTTMENEHLPELRKTASEIEHILRMRK